MGAMHPTFLRLPGGNFLEGDHVASRFNWKRTLGPLVEREGNPGCWRYRATDGLGFLEYLEWCEDLHMEPVLAVYSGFSLRQEFVPPGPELAPFVQEDIEEIEYVTGDAQTTEWGRRRAADGHPAPFPLHYVEIGNEDEHDKSKTYDDRFAQIYDGLKARYPDLKYIATREHHHPQAGPRRLPHLQHRGSDGIRYAPVRYGETRRPQNDDRGMGDGGRKPDA